MFYAQVVAATWEKTAEALSPVPIPPFKNLPHHLIPHVPLGLWQQEAHHHHQAALLTQQARLVAWWKLH